MFVKNIIVFLILIQAKESQAQCGWWTSCTVTSCTNNHEIGENNPSSKNNNRDSEQGVAVLMRHNEYKYACCGFIYKWEFYSGISGPFDAQVWRPDTGNSYFLAGTNTLQANNTGNNEFTTIPNGQRIRCNKDDYIGIFAAGSFPITNKDENNGHDRYKMSPITAPMTSPFSWSSSNNVDQDYAINSFVTPSQIPTIYPLSDVTYYNDEIYVGMFLARALVWDDDIEDQNSLVLTIDSITNNGLNYFEMATGTSNVTMKALAPVQSYVITWKVQDMCSRSSLRSFTINILNRLPVIHNLPATISISEDTLGNVLIYTINATDTVTYPLTCIMTAGNTNIFTVKTISPTTTPGVYTKTGAVFDYDITNSYIVTVQCTDSNDNVKGDLTINLIRNEPPVIHSLPNTTSISEDLSTRTLLHTINVTDPTNDAITCVLNTNTNLFEVAKITSSSADYGIFLKGGTVLNYDITSSYVLSVTCSDKRRGDTEKLTVDLIRNEPPTIVNLPRSCNVHEDTQTETLLYTVSVTDPTNDTVTCSFLTPSSLFYIQVSTNQFEYSIFVRSNAGFSYDTKKSYTLTVSCIDQRRSDVDNFYVYLIRNQPPKFTNLQAKTTVLAPMSKPGDLVFTVMASDRENDQLQYSMTAPNNAPFSINPNTGEICMARSVMVESITGYDLSIFVSDKRNTVGPNTLTVLITEINSRPIFTNLPQTVSVLEGVTLGTVVFQPRVDDFNPGDIHTFSVNYIPPDGLAYFTVNKTDGRVITLVNIDYETIAFKTFGLTITVTDTLMYDSGKLTINILNVNEAPKFTKKSYTLSVPEGKGGTVLQNPYYQCIDPDGDKLIFSFDCGSDTGRLNIDKATGVFSYAVTYDLDVYGTPSNMLCQVYITDGEYSDTADLKITIIDENDNSPIFQHSEYTFFVDANITVGSMVGEVHAKDADVGFYGTFIYHIEQHTIAYSLFKVSNQGKITTKQPLVGYPEGSVLSFRIYAVDVGGRETTTNTTIVIPDMSVPPVVIEEPYQYKTFFTHAPNMAWFVSLLFALFATTVVIVYTIWKSVVEKNKGKISSKVVRSDIRRKPAPRPKRRY